MASLLKKSSVFSDDEIRQLAAAIETPFHLYDEATIRKTCQQFKNAFSWAPQFINYFAIKATPNPHICRIIKEEGFGADCSSLAELLLAEAIGLKGESIMFTSNNTPLSEYKKAKELGVIINLDDISHIDFLHETIGLPDMICFRYNPGSKRTGNVIIGSPEEAKFGVTTEQLPICFSKSKELGCRRFGLHTMIVSNCLDENELIETARMMFELIIMLNELHNIRIEMVDLGGGIGIPYKPDQTPMNLEKLGQKIKELYDEMIVPANLHPLKIAFECGRCITASAGVLVTRIIHQKNTYKKYIGVDACIANLMRPALYGSYHHMEIIPDDNIQILRKLPKKRNLFNENGQTIICDVVGSLCENNDKLATDRALPSTLRIGDLLVIHDAGAHGHAMGFNYNGKLRSAEILKRDAQHTHNKLLCGSGGLHKISITGDYQEIRRSENYSDLFRTIQWIGNLPGKHLVDCQFVIGHIGLCIGFFMGALSMKFLMQKRQ